MAFLLDSLEEVNGYKLFTQIVDADAGQLREIATNIVERDKVADLVVVINSDGNIVACANQSILDNGMKMGDVIKLVGDYLGGRGGGKPNLAQGAGMTQFDKKDEAFQAIKDQINSW